MDQMQTQKFKQDMPERKHCNLKAQSFTFSYHHRKTLSTDEIFKALQSREPEQRTMETYLDISTDQHQILDNAILSANRLESTSRPNKRRLTKDSSSHTFRNLLRDKNSFSQQPDDILNYQVEHVSRDSEPNTDDAIQKKVGAEAVESLMPTLALQTKKTSRNNSFEIEEDQHAQISKTVTELEKKVELLERDVDDKDHQIRALL